MKKILITLAVLMLVAIRAYPAKAACPAFQAGGVSVTTFNGLGFPVPSVTTFNNAAFGFPTNAAFFGVNSFGFVGGAPLARGSVTTIDTRFGAFGQPRRQIIRQLR